MIWMLAGILALPAGTLNLVVGNVTCASCAVSIRSVLSQNHLNVIQEDLVFPYARVQVKASPEADLAHALKVLHTIGYSPFVVVEKEEKGGAKVKILKVGEDTVRVMPARAWLTFHPRKDTSRQKGGKP